MSRPDGRFQPLTIVADLASPVVTNHPILFDGILHYGAGAAIGAQSPGGLCEQPPPPEIRALWRLPLARCHHHELWWFAASQATPWGPEQRGHLHRRPATDELIRWTTTRTINIGAGPDKALRIPYYRWIAMHRLWWTCVGDIDAIAHLLSWVHGIGNDSTHGHGWVLRWEVMRGGPPFAAYLDDVRLRHLPAVVAEGDLRWRGRATRKHLPLTPPYHERGRAVPVVQMTGDGL